MHNSETKPVAAEASEAEVEEAEEEEEVFTSSDPAFWDYVRLSDFMKKTGIDGKDCHAFCAKELFDNACNIVEKWRLNNGLITIDIKNDPEAGTFIISVSNSNPQNKPVFGTIALLSRKCQS